MAGRLIYVIPPYSILALISPFEDNRPAIVFYFGGGWVGGSPSHFSSQAQHYVDLGLVMLLADCRVTSRHKTKAKHCLEDARDTMCLCPG